LLELQSKFSQLAVFIRKFYKPWVIVAFVEYPRGPNLPTNLALEDRLELDNE
jgi:hypothetical protein